MVAQEDFRSRRGESVDGRAGKLDAGEPDIEALFAHTRAEFASLIDSLKGIAFVEWQGIRLRAIDVFFRGAFFLCILGFGLAASISAALMLVSGARGALHSWSGAEWVGDLGAGNIVFAGVILGGLGVRAALRIQLVKQTEKRLALAASPAPEVKA